MNRRPSLAVLALGASVALLTSACGAGGATAPQTPAANAAGGAGAGSAAAAAGGDAALPVNSMVAEEGGGGNDGNDAKVPQGMTEAKAVAAGMGKDGTPVVSVKATDTTCEPDTTTVPAGKVWFKITNQGVKINELYLERPDGTELVEVEKIKKGTSGAFSTTVQAGAYLVACEPGMADQQVRTGITVTAM